MTRMDSTALNVPGVAGHARAWLDSLNGELRRAGAPGAAIRSALEALAQASEAIMAAKAKATQLQGEPRYSTQYKLDQCKALVGDAYNEGRHAALALGSALDKARQSISASLMPARPSSADASLLGFQAQEVAKALEAARDVVKVAAALLADAIASDDQALQYVIAGGPMLTTYKRLGVNMPMLMTAFADVLGKSEAKPANPSAALLPIVSAGGSGSLRSMVDGALYAIGTDETAYNGWLLNAARSGAFVGPWEPGGAQMVR